MEKVEFEITEELKAYIEEVRGYFNGIDSVVAELAEEKQQLEEELQAIVNATELSADNLKRKIKINRKLSVVSRSLEEAEMLREQTQERNWEEINHKETKAKRSFEQKTNNLVAEKEKEITELLQQAQQLREEAISIKEQANAFYNSHVVRQVNSIVKPHYDTEREVLRPIYFVKVKELKDYIK